MQLIPVDSGANWNSDLAGSRMQKKPTGLMGLSIEMVVVPERFERPTLRFVVWHFMTGLDWANSLIIGYIDFHNSPPWR